MGIWVFDNARELGPGTNKYLTELPDELGGMINLRSLACNECKIGKFPKRYT